ncbi:hypothetical protein DPMN_168212, partial [Dreissena polymorpha]
MAEGEKETLEDEFDYSSSDSEYKDCEDIPGASLYNVFKGFHVAGKYREAMDVPPELKQAKAPAYIEEDAPHSIDTVDFGSVEKAVDEARGPGVKDRIKMFEAVGNTEAYEQNLQSEKRGPNIGESDSMSILQDYSIIESALERENTDDMSTTQSLKKKPPVAPKPVMKVQPQQSEDCLNQDEPPKGEFKLDFSQSLFADQTQDSESSVAEETLMNRDSSENDLDMVCSNTELSSVPQEQEILKADQLKEDLPEEHVMTDDDKKCVVTETPNVELSAETLDIENADEQHSACQFENDLSDHDSSSEDNHTTKVEQSEKCRDGFNESRETESGRSDADPSAYLERGLDPMEGEPCTLSADNEQESVDYENVPQMSDPNADNALHNSEIYEPASEHTIEDILPVRSHCAKDDEQPKEGNQLSVEDTDADEAEDSIQLVEAQTNQHIETFRSMSSSVETADLGWSYIEPKTEDGNAPLSDCQTEELDESSSSISVISSSDDNITMKYEDAFVPTKDDDSSSQIPDQQPVSDVEDRNEDEPFLSATEDDRAPTPPPKSLVVMEELKSLAYSQESEPMSGPYQQLGNDNMQSEEASQHPTDNTSSTYLFSAFHSQPIPPIQGSNPNMFDPNLNKGPFVKEQKHGVPFSMPGFSSNPPSSGFPGLFPTDPLSQWPPQPPIIDPSNPGRFPQAQAPWPPFMHGMMPPIQGQFPGQSMPPQMYGGYPPLHFVPPGTGQGVLPPFHPGPQFPTFGFHSPRAPTRNKETPPTDAKTQPFKTEQPQGKESPISANIETPVASIPRSQPKPESPKRQKSTGRDKPRNVNAESPAKDELKKQQRATPTHATPTHQRQTTAQLTKDSSSQKNVTKQSETKPTITERKPKESEKYERDTPKKEVKKDPKIPEKEVGQDTSTQYIFMNVLNPPLADCVSQTYMQNYLEICTDKDIDPKDIVFNYSRTCIVFSTKGKPDMERLKQKVKDKILSGTKFEVRLIDRPCSVAISREAGLEISESLELFLESPRNHGGELDLQQQMFETDDGSCIVATFKDPKVAEAFSQKKDHVLNNKSLVVSLFFRCDWGEVWDPDLHKVVLPEPIVIQLTNNRKRLLQRPACMTFILELESKSCCCEFTDEGLKIMCTLNRTTTDIKTRKAKWLEEVATFVENFMRHELEHYDLDCCAQIWEDMKTLCKKYEHEEKVAVCCNDKTKLIEIDSLKGCGQDVNDNLLYQAKALERQLKRTSECMQLKELHIRVMSKLGTFESMKETDLNVNPGEDTVTMEGQPDDITTMQKNILETKNRIQHVNLNQCLSERCLCAIKDKQALCDKIDEALKNENIEAVWKVEGSSLQCAYVEDTMYSSQYEEETKATIRNIFLSNVTDKSISFYATDVSIMNTSEFLEISQELTEENDTLAEWYIDEGHLKMHFVGWTKNVDKMHNTMQVFVDEHFIRQVVIQPSVLKFSYLKRHKQDFLSEIKQTLKEKLGKLELIDDKSSVVVYGNKKSREDIKQKMDRFFASIICDELKIEKMGVSKVFEDVMVRGKITEIENQTCCIIQERGKDADVARQSVHIEDDHYESIQVDGEVAGAAPKSQAKVLYDRSQKQHKELSLPNGMKISVIEGEIGKQKGDVFVISTSPKLDLRGGKAGNAILQVAGQNLQTEINGKYKSEIKFGEIAYVSGGQMKCEHLYMTCLPGWDQKDLKPIEVLKTAVKSALELVSQQKMKSILFSALGCGQLKYPAKMVAHEMMHVASDFGNANPKSTLKKVKFVVYHLDEKVKNAFKQELKNRLSGRPATASAQPLRKGTATIELAVEDIAAQKVDVIVCSTSPQMDLTNGACNALLKVGGETLQEECKKKYNNNLKEGDVAEIGSGKLQCKAIFLVVLPKYTGDESIENLKGIIKTCVRTALSRGFKSLAMPALGTGNLHYRKDDVARCMFDSLIELGTGDEEAPDFSVRLIMHFKDSAVIEAFYKFMDIASKRGHRGQRSYSYKKKQVCESDEVSDYSISKDGFELHGTMLKVAIGDILHQKADAVVASVGKDFDMHGGVAHALNRMCPNLKEQCEGKKQKLNAKGVVLMPVKELKAKQIIFVQYAESLPTWKERIAKCLKIAHKHKFATVSFPVLGSGSGFHMLRPEVSAGCLFDALHDFLKAHNNTINVKEVRLIIYGGQQEMHKPIMEALHKKLKELHEGGTISLIRSWGRKLKQSSFEFLGIDDGTVPFEDRPAIRKRQYFHQQISDRKMQKALQSSLELVICTDSADNIDKCKSLLDKIIEEAMVTEKIDGYQNIIPTLTQDECNTLDSDAMLVDFKIDSQGGIITVHGEIHHVHDAVTKIRQKLNEILKERGDLEQAQELVKKVKWYYEDEENMEFVPYAEMQSFKMEMAYMKKEKTYHFFANDIEFEVDFDELKEYPVNDKNDWVKVSRKDVFTAENAALPEYWKPMLPDQNVKPVILARDDPDFTRIETRFLSELSTGKFANSPGHKYDKSKTKINQIQRIQNKALYRQYQTKKKQLEESNPNRPATMPLERELWHGTNENAMESINLHGFNRSYAGNN